MQNQEIKARAKEAGVRLWEIAERLGMRDDAFSRKMRRELPDDERENILAIIDQIEDEREV